MLPAAPHVAAPSIAIAAIPFDDPWGLVLGAVAVAALLFLLWSQSGARPLLLGGLAGLAVALGALAADRLVVTDREAVEGLFERLAAAAEAGDTATILDAFDPAVAPPRAEAERALREFRAEEVRVTRIDVVSAGRGPGRRARADLLAHVRGSFQGNAAGPGNFLVDLAVDLHESAGRWLITGFERRDGHPPGRR